LGRRDEGEGGEAVQGVGGDGQEAVGAEEPGRGFEGEISVLRAEGAAGAWQKHKAAGGAGAGRDLGEDQAEAGIGLHDWRDPLGADQAGADKKETRHASKQNRDDVAPARRGWKRKQGSLDPARRVFIDESAAETNMTRLRGRSPKGERLICHPPHGHWRTTTMVSSVRLDGTSACMTIEGATNTEVFHAYVRAVLVPSLRPADLVAKDNLGAHKNERTLALIEEAGAEVRFLPAYSDLNPVEMR
jgi:hypothetical protein